MFQDYLAGLLRRERLNRRMTQAEMSEFLHISRQTYSNYENNRRSPSLDTLIQILQILELPAEQIFQELPGIDSQDRQLLRQFHRLTPELQREVLCQVQALQAPD